MANHCNNNLTQGYVNPAFVACITQELQQQITVLEEQIASGSTGGGGGSSYLVYTALLTQTGTDVPTAIVLENTLDATVTFIRDSQGGYTCTLSQPLLDPSKTYITIESSRVNTDVIDVSTPPLNVEYVQYPIDQSNVFIGTSDDNINKDGLLQNTPFEIRIYP